MKSTRRWRLSPDAEKRARCWASWWRERRGALCQGWGVGGRRVRPGVHDPLPPLFPPLSLDMGHPLALNSRAPMASPLGGSGPEAPSSLRHRTCPPPPDLAGGALHSPPDPCGHLLSVRVLVQHRGKHKSWLDGHFNQRRSCLWGRLRCSEVFHGLFSYSHPDGHAKSRDSPVPAIFGPHFNFIF